MAVADAVVSNATAEAVTGIFLKFMVFLMDFRLGSILFKEADCYLMTPGKFVHHGRKHRKIEDQEDFS